MASSTRSVMKVCVKCSRREEHELVSYDKINNTVTILHREPNVFTFDKVFEPKSNQSELYDESISSMVDEVLDGHPCTVIAYGKKRTGRTYIMEGDKEAGEELSPDSGVIPRAVWKIFQTLNSGDTLYDIKASIFDIKDDQIMDLLALEDPKKQTKTISILEDGNGCANVKGLIEKSLYNMKDLYYLLKRRASRRSSSHTMISIKVHMTKAYEDMDVIKSGRFLFVTLEEGSHKGRGRASEKIDKSLHTLDRVVNAILEHSVHIPYRDSKLTRLLRDSLNGNTNTCIIATISPSMGSNEILDTLNYVSRLKNIKRKTQEKMETEESSLNKEIENLFLQTEQMETEPEIKGAYFVAAKFDTNEKFGSFIASKSCLTSDLKYNFKKYKDGHHSLSSKLKKLGDNSRMQSLAHLDVSQTLLEVEEMEKFVDVAYLETKSNLLEFKQSLDVQRYKEKPKKCVIYAMEMLNKEKRYCDKVNYYIYDEKKFGDIWQESLTNLENSKTSGVYRAEISINLEEGVVIEPITSISYCHTDWSYIAFKTQLFRIGGSYYSYEDTISIIKGKLIDKGPGHDSHLREATTSVGILDLKNIKASNKWREGPNMNFPRRRPHIFILNDKLYVAGGLFTKDKEVIKEFKFIEVLDNEKWITLPDHPRFLDDRQGPDNNYFLSRTVTGVIQEKGMIIAGVDMDDFTKNYCFYTYKPEDASPKWEPYISISKNERAQMMINELNLKPAVVSGKLMLWLLRGLPNMLCIMDFENDKTYYLNLVEHLLVPPGDIQMSEPVLLKVEEGKFGLFWTVRGSMYLSGSEVYDGLHSTIFTLQIKSEEPFVVVEVITSKFCLIPDICTHKLQAICIADIEDSMDLTPINY